eukprot:9738500-Ditylum_brightwellii.AAC.1
MPYLLVLWLEDKNSLVGTWREHFALVINLPANATQQDNLLSPDNFLWRTREFKTPLKNKRKALDNLEHQGKKVFDDVDGNFAV